MHLSTGNEMNNDTCMLNKKNIIVHMIWVCILVFLFACDLPKTEQGTLHKDTVDYVVYTEIALYPGNEIIFYEAFGLFSTTILMHSPDTAIGSYSITLGFDSGIIQYESIYSLHAVLNTEIASNAVAVTASTIDIGPGNYLEVCTITWKALLTGITEISLQVDEILTESGDTVTPPEMITNSIKIVKEIGILSFDGPGDVEKEADFTTNVIIDSEDKSIKEYDLDIVYDPESLQVNTNIGNNGVIVGTDGFLQDITHEEGRITITGIDESGTGPGSDLEFLTIHWNAIDSGVTNIFCETEKMVTVDDVYIKPQIRVFSTTIYTDSSKPIVDIWLDPPEITVAQNDPFETSLYLNTIGWVIAAYGIDIYYDPAVLELDTSQAGGLGIEQGSDGFLTVVNSTEPGVISTAGFDMSGKAPNPELELLVIYWKAIGSGESSLIEVDVRNLVDVRTVPVIFSEPVGSSVSIN